MNDIRERFIVYLGLTRLSVACLNELLRLGAPPCAVVTAPPRVSDIPDRRRHPLLPVASPLQRDRRRLASALGRSPDALPFRHVESTDSVAIRSVGAQRLVSLCFPRRIPAVVRDAFSAGGINVHPSLLPAYRGPVPVFWQIRDDRAWLGLSVHHMTDVIDAGDVIVQQRFGFADDRSEKQINGYLGVRAAHLLIDILSHRRICGVTANHAPSWHPFPGGTDYCLAAHWPARRAARFLAATLWRNHPYHYSGCDAQLLITAVHGVRASPAPGSATKLEDGPCPRRVSLAFADAWIDVDAVCNDRASNR